MKDNHRIILQDGFLDLKLNAIIKAKIEEAKIENAWLQFDPDLEEYFKNRTYITVADNVTFPSNSKLRDTSKKVA